MTIKMVCMHQNCFMFAPSYICFVFLNINRHFFLFISQKLIQLGDNKLVSFMIYALSTQLLIEVFTVADLYIIQRKE